MTELIIGQTDESITTFKKSIVPGFIRKLQEFSSIGKIDGNEEEIEKALNRIKAFEEQGNINKLTKEIHQEVKHLYKFSKAFLSLEQNLIYTLNKVKKDEGEIMKVVSHLAEHGFPEGEANELVKETAQVIHLVNESMRRVSDMMGALEKKNI